MPKDQVSKNNTAIKKKVPKVPKIKVDGKKSVKNKGDKQQNFEFAPCLLFQTVYFLNNTCNKYLSLGYDVKNGCRPLFTIGTSLGFVTLSTSDWMMLMINKIQIEYWFNNIGDSFEPGLITSKNIQLSQIRNGEQNFIMIENLNATRNNKTVLLSEEEYRKIIDIDSFLFLTVKQMQQNSIMIDEYYNMYIYYCIAKGKKLLTDEDFFPSLDLNNANFDLFRLFKEIPLNCREEIERDVVLNLPQM